jgi:CBS domain-containing protein
MSLSDQENFLRSIHPFELLTKGQLQKAVQTMNIAYYPKDTLLISPEKKAQYLYLVIKGEVGEYHEDELVKVYSKSSTFDADALLYEKNEESFIVLEELLCFEMAKKDFENLLHVNTLFKEYYLNDLANKIQSAKQKEYTTQMSGFMIAKISDTYLHKPCIVSFDTSIMDALKKMEELETNCILVQNQEELGIVTDSVLRKNILYQNYDKYAPIGPIALHPIISIEHDDFLFNALLSFTKNSIKRIVVTKGTQVIGILEQLDLLSYFANHSYLVSVKIKKATNLEELKEASRDFIHIVRKLHAKGTKIEYISKLISELNTKIYEKLYKIILPKKFQMKACLIVMGSEGREEQILKTDQDNALIVHDDEVIEDYLPYMQEFTKTLIELGFPTCKGNIMVSNPYWCKKISSYKDEIDRWIESPSRNDYMYLAIFLDSLAVAGDSSYLQTLKESIFSTPYRTDVFMANFAKNALLFETPIGIFTNLIASSNKLDIKKGAIFPIVQGIRALALEWQLPQTNTIARIRQLEKKEILETSFAQALIEAFDTLLNLRLHQKLNSNLSNSNINNEIDLTTLNQLELELLKDSFKIVNKFKKFLIHHFKINMVQ